MKELTNPKEMVEELNSNLQKNRLKGLMYLFSIVRRVYYNPNEISENKKRVAYMNWTTGEIGVPIGEGTAGYMIRQAQEGERYEVGLEDYNYFSPDIAEKERKNRPKDLQEDFKLQSLTIHHIFLKEEYIGEVFTDYDNDTKIRLLTKTKKEKS